MKNKIKELRFLSGLSQEKLAEKVGVARQTILSLEQGRYNPSLALAVKITRALAKKAVEEVFEV